MSRWPARAAASSTKRAAEALVCALLALAVGTGGALGAGGTGDRADAAAAAKKKCKKAKKGAGAAKKGKCRKPKNKPPAPGPGGSPPASQLAISPSATDFGTYPAGTDSAATSFTVTNVGNAASGTPASSLSGPAADQFQVVSTTCAAALAPTQACSVSARFSPESAGEQYALLNVTAAGGGGASAALTGRTPTGALLRVTPAPYDFGSVIVGAGIERPFTVSNVGVANSSALALTTTGGPFLVTGGTCLGTVALPPSMTCSVAVTFDPPGTGPWSSTLRVSATAGGVAESQLSGTGS